MYVLSQVGQWIIFLFFYKFYFTFFLIGVDYGLKYILHECCSSIKTAEPPIQISITTSFLKSIPRLIRLVSHISSLITIASLLHSYIHTQPKKSINQPSTPPPLYSNQYSSNSTIQYYTIPPIQTTKCPSPNPPLPPPKQ